MRILLVDDDQMIRKAATNFLEEQLGHKVTQCKNGNEALNSFIKEPFPMVLTDIKMPGIDGIELLKRLKIKSEGKNTDVVLLTGHGTLNTAIQALRNGAYDYLLKPVDVEELAAVVERIAEHQSLLKENYELTKHFDEKLNEATIHTQEKLEQLQTAYAEVVGIGKIGVYSEKMHNVVGLAEKFHEDRSIPVLIEGETGTGKEIIARMIHYGKGDVTTPFITINCSAIAPNLFESELFGYEGGAFSGAKNTGMIGKFELAQGGTLFLDEIGDLPMELQPKLLRAIQEREIYRLGGVKKIALDIRIICATNRDLQSLTKKEEFRDDLYYRLNTGKIHIPPLREIPESILPLAELFLEKHSQKKNSRLKLIHKDAAAILENHTWSGNVRELENAVERVVLLHDNVEILPDYLKFLSSDDKDIYISNTAETNKISIDLPPDNLIFSRLEAEVIKKVLFKFNGNKTQAAAYLGISRNTLRSKLNDR
ncbi:sigma-54-dependent transcriptional regulator [candidate division KSB1 bacterium]